MNSCIVQEILKFDPHRPMASVQVQVITTVAILVFSSLTFTAVLKHVMPKSFSDKMDTDRTKELAALHKKGVTVHSLMVGEILNGSLHAPISEELFFRFFLYKLILVRGLKLNPHVGNWVQAAIFGGLHLSNTVYSDQHPTMSLAQSISSGITGLVCGYSYYYTNSILPAMMAHVINNLIASYDQIQTFANYVQT